MLWLRWLVSLLLLIGISLLSRIPHGRLAEHGVLRLSWKTTGEKIRIATPQAEGDDVPVHMRAARSLEEKMRDYRLIAEVDGKVWLDKLMRPPGFHHDRPISVFEELDLPPGEHDVRLRFWPVPEDGAKWKPEIERRVRIEAGGIETLSLPESPEQGT